MRLADLLALPEEDCAILGIPFPFQGNNNAEERDEVHRTVVSGPRRCGKTSLAFHACYAHARRGGDVLVLCNKLRIEESTPVLPASVSADDELWDRVHMKYVASSADVRKVRNPSRESYIVHLHHQFCVHQFFFMCASSGLRLFTPRHGARVLRHRGRRSSRSGPHIGRPRSPNV